MKHLKVLIVFLVAFVVLGLAVVQAQEEKNETSMFISWWHGSGWINLNLILHKIIDGFFLFDFQEGQLNGRLVLGVPLVAKTSNDWPCSIIASGPSEAFEGQRVNLFLVWKQKYGLGTGKMEAVPVQLQLPFLLEGGSKQSLDFPKEFPKEICQEPFFKNGIRQDPFFPERLFPESIVIKKKSNPSPSVCREDVKICSDGSYVYRQPPSCEFQACPF